MMTSIRTTLTLEDDLAERLNELSRETRTPFKVVVNQALRRGLADLAPHEAVFHVKAYAGNLLPEIDDRSFNELAWKLE